ncbi:hypothetical protein BH11PSE6_BH11PSE6_12500 [soil metagenome]|jgi:hypothetical protein
MATALHAITDRAAAFATRQPRAAIGGSILCCIVMAELVAAVALNGLV